MNSREENLIRMLFEKKNTFILIEEMAEKEDCSDKTIRNSLDRVEEYLNKFSPDIELERKRGKGIRLKVWENSNITIEDVLDTTISKRDLYTDERRYELAYRLLMDTKPVTLTELSERYYLSKEAIGEDLNEIGKQLEKYNLKIVSKQRIGTFIEGSEKDKREALSQNIKSLYKFNKEKSTIKSIFMPHEIDLVNKGIMDLQNQVGIYFTDESSHALAIHVLFMVKRIKLNQAVSMSQEEKDFIKRKPQYLWALKLSKYLEQSLSLIFPEDEVIYLAVHLLGIRYSGGTDMESIDFNLKSDSNIMDILLNRLLDNMEDVYSTSFRTDEILVEGLKLHLYGSFNRIRYGLPLENPLFEDIKRMSPYLYYRALDTVDKFNSEYNINIPKEEIAYITVHFQASIERNNNNLLKKSTAVVVCHLGIGVSNYLKIKLEKVFPWIDFKASVSVKEIKKYIENNPTNFIFSTVNIDNLGLKYIKINSIIDKNEEVKIKEAVNNNILYNDLENKTKVHKFMNKKFIFLRQKFHDKFQIIEFLTSKLYEAERVSCNFYKSVLKRENIDTTEMGSLLAIPHGDADYITDSAIAVLTLEDPIIWDNERVQIVFLLAVKKEDYVKDNTMRSFFKYLHGLSNNRESLNRLIEEKSVDEFFKLIK